MNINFTIETKDVLLDKIIEYNRLYRLGTPKVSDAIYDGMVNYLKEIDPDNEWFKHPEPATVASGRKVRLPIPMKSLNKAKDISEVIKWYKSLGLSENTKVVCMPKFDGLSLLYDERFGKAYSRGGVENEGQDCTEHIKACSIDRSKSPLLYTYGEFLFSTANWIGNFQGKVSEETGEPYKSPRNTAAGLLNRDTPSSNLSFATYFRYGADPTSLMDFQTYEQLISYICSTFHQERLYASYSIQQLSDKLLMNLFQKWRKQYYIDGIVIYIDDLHIWDIVGRHQTSGNPLYTIAYKHPDFTESFETTVKGVNWKVSKSGALKPVVNIETVDTGDCNMENPTGYNAGWIDDMGIAKNAKILVTRSGGVIPKILEILVPANMEEQQGMWDELSACPHCGQPTQWNSNYIELCCTNKDCPGIKLAKIVFFFMTCGVENVGEETFTKLFNAGYTTIKSILDITFDQLLQIDGFGESLSNIILENNTKIKKGVDIAVLMHASDCFPGIGEVKAKKILNEISDDERQSFYERRFVRTQDFLDSEEFKAMTKTMQSFILGVPLFYEFMNEVDVPILLPTEMKCNKNGKCAGMSVCFSGIRDSQLEEDIQREGGVIASGISKKTTHLVVKDVNGSSSKITKARTLGIPILSLDNFKRCI